MERLPDWQARLHEAINENKELPFEFGSHDCALFGAKMVEAITGEDIAKNYRGKYKTQKGGVRAMKRSGYTDHIAYYESLFEETPKSFATIGDLAIIDSDEGKAIGVVAGSDVLAISPDQGLVRINILDPEIIKTLRV